MKWIICFCESPNLGFWKFFTKKHPKFSHAFAVQYFPELDQWIKIEFTTQGFNFIALQGENANELIAFMISECTCIEYEATSYPIWLPRLLYCVSFMKHLCNIRNIFILTPYQLYCELLKRGGQVIFKQKGEEHGLSENTISTTTRSSSRSSKKGRARKTGKGKTDARRSKVRQREKNKIEPVWS
tara:strand:- start:2715 stop:3269 length:555 start_codon:yes stop_codon:yes gene_type:complete